MADFEWRTAALGPLTAVRPGLQLISSGVFVGLVLTLRVCVCRASVFWSMDGAEICHILRIFRLSTRIEAPEKCDNTVCVFWANPSFHDSGQSAQ